MDKNDNNKISLINCDFNKKKIRLNSPYSIAACELIGIIPEDLIYITKDEYIRGNQDCQNIKKSLQEERYNHFNSRRLKLIELAKQKREELIQEDKNRNKTISKEKDKEKINKNTEYGKFQHTEHSSNINNKNNPYSTYYTKRDHLKKSSSVKYMGMTGFNTNNVWGTSTAIKEEREKLKKLKERQEINIRLQIDYECAMEENRRKNIEKMRLKEEKEERKRIEKNRLLIEKLRKEEEKRKK